MSFFHYPYDFTCTCKICVCLFHVGGSSYIQCITWLVTDIEAMTEFKHSLRHKNRGILRDSASLHYHGL